MHVSVSFSELVMAGKPSHTLELRACAMVFPRSSLDCTPSTTVFSEVFPCFRPRHRALMIS